MPKRLAVFLDGTWNRPDSNTNVWRLKSLVAAHDENGIAQATWYDTGVGTAWHDRFRGGALGRGLDTNIRQAYQWLVEHYEPEDEIFLFGFSRGAYSARSLAGLIAKCGLLHPGAPMSVPRLFDRYRGGARPIYEVQWGVWKKDPTITPQDRALLDASRRVKIQLIGVWDTVGALGIPFGNIPGLGRRTLQFHNTRPSNLFRHLYQAVAIDEHRRAYQASLWTRFVPNAPPQPAKEDADGNGPDDTAKVEQRWFPGAHANVGGGYEDNGLASLTLAWMQAKARQAGLRFRREISPGPDDHLEPVVDSYAKFLSGAYRLATLGRRYHRVLGADMVPKVAEDGTPGRAGPIAETVDPSAIRRWQELPKYRPPTLSDWARRRNINLDTTDWTQWAG